MKFHLAVLVALSSLLLLNISETSTEILPQTGFWNYLPVFGIWARIVHYLAVDSNGLGGQVKNLDSYFKDEYTPQKYVQLVQDVVNKLPKVVIAFRVLKIKENLRNVRDPVTGKTLGDAFDIIHDLESDDNVVNEIASRLHLVSPDEITMIESSPSDFELKETLKKTFLENPSVVEEVLKDPQVVNFISSSILQYLSSDRVIDGIESLQTLISVLELSYPKMFREGQNPVFDLKDEKTGISFIKSVEILLDIIQNDEFPKKLAKLLNNETMTYLQQKTQDVVSTVSEVSKPSPNKKTRPQMTAEQFANTLSSFGVKLDEPTAENILQASRNNQLGEKAHQFLAELSKIEDLTPAKVAEFITEKGVTVDEKSVEDAINTITSLPPKMLTQVLQGVGLNIPKAQVTEMRETIGKLKKTYDESEESHPSESTGQATNSNTSAEDSTQNSEIISDQDDAVEDENSEA